MSLQSINPVPYSSYLCCPTPNLPTVLSNLRTQDSTVSINYEHPPGQTPLARLGIDEMRVQTRGRMDKESGPDGINSGVRSKQEHQCGVVDMDDAFALQCLRGLRFQGFHQRHPEVSGEWLPFDICLLFLDPNPFGGLLEQFGLSQSLVYGRIVTAVVLM